MTKSNIKSFIGQEIILFLKSHYYLSLAVGKANELIQIFRIYRLSIGRRIIQSAVYVYFRPKFHICLLIHVGLKSFPAGAGIWRHYNNFD